MKKGMSVLFVLFFLAVFSTQNAFGGGFAVYTQGATPLGQGNSVIAHANDPSAIFFNPALINKLPDNQFEIGTTMLAPSNKFQSSTGASNKTKGEVFFPPTFYATHKFTNDFSAGLGIFSHFGLSTNWGEAWEGKYIATKSKLTTYTVNPVVSYRVTPDITVAAGLDILSADASLGKMLNFPTLFGLPDARQTLKGDATGVGWNAGLAIDITNDLTFGASYRSNIRMALTGNVSHDLPPGTPAGIAALFPNTPARTTIKLPAQAFAGLAYKGFKPLTIEIGGRYEGWRSYKELEIDSDLAIAGSTVNITPKNWKNTYSANIGARYQLNNTVAVNAGYIYDANAIPDDTFEPAIPGNTSHIFSAGTDIAFKQFLFGLAYSFQNQETRTNNANATASGKYKTNIHMVGLSLKYAF